MDENNKKIDNNLFDDFSINDLFKKIYENHKDKETRILDILDDVNELMKDASTAAIVGPVVKDLAQSSVHNDELLIKLANVATKLIENPNKQKLGFEEMIPMSKAEKNDLLVKIDNMSIEQENGQ